VEEDSWRRVEEARSLKGVIHTRLAKVILNDSAIALLWEANDHVAKSDIHFGAGNPAGNAHHQAHAEALEDGFHPRRDHSRRADAHEACRERANDNVVRANTSEDEGTIVAGIFVL